MPPPSVVFVGRARGIMPSGARRLEACKLLGWKEVPARVVDSISTASAQLTAERDENTCRLDMKPSEAARLGMAIEALDEEQRKENITRNLPTQQSGDSPPRERLGRAREVVGPSVGMSGQTYGRAKAVVKAAEDPATIQTAIVGPGRGAERITITPA